MVLIYVPDLYLRMVALWQWLVYFLWIAMSATLATPAPVPECGGYYSVPQSACMQVAFLFCTQFNASVFHYSRVSLISNLTLLAFWVLLCIVEVALGAASGAGIIMGLWGGLCGYAAFAVLVSTALRTGIIYWLWRLLNRWRLTRCHAYVFFGTQKLEDKAHATPSLSSKRRALR